MRKVIKTAHGPYELKPQSKPVFICMCGLSDNQPFCNGSHLKTLDEKEDKCYEYNEKKKNTNVTAIANKSVFRFSWQDDQFQNQNTNYGANYSSSDRI